MKILSAFFIVFLSLISCKNNVEEVPQENTQDVSIIFGNKKYTPPQLTPPVKEQVLKWGALEDFFHEAQSVNGSNFESLRNTTERLEEYTDSLFKNIPDTLNTTPIHSRLMVIKTRTGLLDDVAHQSRIDSAKIQDYIEELNISIENFIAQLNEKFQKDNIDYQRKENEESELKKQKRYTDSIYKLELQDTKKKGL